MSYPAWNEPCRNRRQTSFFWCVASLRTFFNYGGLCINIKLELLKRPISELISDRIKNFEIYADKITNTIAIKMLSEIQDIIRNDDLSDFDAIDAIVEVFIKYDIDFGLCHDF